MMKVAKVMVETGKEVEGSLRKERRKAAKASTLETGVRCYNRVPNGGDEQTCGGAIRLDTYKSGKAKARSARTAR